MKIFIHIDSPGLDTEFETIRETITSWIAECGCTAQLVDERDEDGEVETLGLRIDTGKKAMLKKALDFLYGLAKEQSVDFAVGYLDDAEQAHKVCYFGDEEGRPDISEIGSYLGLRR